MQPITATAPADKTAILAHLEQQLAMARGLMPDVVRVIGMRTVVIVVGDADKFEKIPANSHDQMIGKRLCCEKVFRESGVLIIFRFWRDIPPNHGETVAVSDSQGG